MLVLGSGAAFGWVLWMALTESIWAAYATYILFEGTMYLLLAVAAAKIAQMYANGSLLHMSLTCIFFILVCLLSFIM